jgi:hypothetical protein
VGDQLDRVLATPRALRAEITDAMEQHKRRDIEVLVRRYFAADGPHEAHC